MSLHRYLPIPSHRMSLMWTLMSVKDAVVLEYGPAGTTHYSMGLFGSMGLGAENRLFTTHITEDDVVMGDVSRLENAITEIDANFKPKVIFVVASAVTAVIGTDIIGVCKYMQEKVSARLIPMEEGGLRGDYTTGLREAYKMLATQLPAPSAEKTRVYNIIGASAGSYRIRSDVWELQDLLARAFGLSPGVVLGLDTDVESIEKMSGAAVNLVLRNEALQSGEIMLKRFGTPLVYGAPYGYRGTLTWLSEIGEVLGCEINKEVEASLMQKDQESKQSRMPGMMGMRQLNATLVGDYDLLVGVSEFLQELGISPINKLCSHSLKEISPQSNGIIHYDREKERLEVLKSIHGHLLLADDVSAHVVAKDNMYVCVSFPFIRHPQVATHLPIMGERGADMLMEEVQKFRAMPALGI